MLHFFADMGVLSNEKREYIYHEWLQCMYCFLFTQYLADKTLRYSYG